MSKMRKPFTALLIALIVLISFTGITRFYISQNVQLVQVVAAAEPIPPRSEIIPEQLKVIQVPKGYAPNDAAPSVNIFAEDAYYTGEIGLNEGEIITKQKVFTKENISHSHTLTLAPGETILGVSTDLVRSAGASIYPGSKVRALAYIPKKEDKWNEIYEPSRVEVIFDNLKVIGVVNTEAADTNLQEQRGKVPSVVKLAVTSEQEAVLIRYQEEAGYKVWFTVLPEHYVPDSGIKDYYYRLEHGIEEELHKRELNELGEEVMSGSIKPETTSSVPVRPLN